MNNPIGLYIHVPFCESKCAYCDFYSQKSSDNEYTKYVAALCQHISAVGVRLSPVIDTVYFGGGTPTLLGGKRITQIIDTIKISASSCNAEITVEANPADNLSDDLKSLAKAGVNRLSIGVQSAINTELHSLSRRHTNKDVIKVVSDAKLAGFDNISVDLMLGIPNQTIKTLKSSLDFVLLLGIKHISCYILKIEPDTPFGKANTSELNLPSDDTVSDMYLFMSEYLQKNGFEHYEISNFAKPGYRSKHNMKYWQCKEYLGLGPAAHSFINGKRFFFERNTQKYISSPEIINDGSGGDSDEYIMLRLRLSDGLNYKEYETTFNRPIDKSIIEKAKEIEKLDLIKFTKEGFSLTNKGFLISNTIITNLLY